MGVMQIAYEAAVIGGGFFGCMTALRLREQYRRVVLLEREADLLLRASYHNQARVHNGYHYPRSLTTAMRSRLNFPRFVSQFESCIDRDFDQYYAVARQFSKVTASQFRNFFRRVGAPLEPAPQPIRRLFNDNLIEEVFHVTEYAFDALRLRGQVRSWLNEAGVDIHLRTEVQRIAPLPAGRVMLWLRTPEADESLQADEVFNCTYAQTNQVLAASGLPLVPLKQELTELALVEVPPLLRRVGITVMCGPFFSVMPFPARGLHSLSHVRYTPHDSWEEGPGRFNPAYEEMVRRRMDSNFAWMVQDAARYVPILRQSRYVDSLWEVKTVLPRNEADDGRPILFRRHHGLANFHCVLGAKIDNVYDLLDEMDGRSGEERRSA
jgi:glycine/D-amino acid oxidase-like deaminating enzyme